MHVGIFAQAGPIADAPPLASHFMAILLFILTTVAIIAIITVVASGIMYIASAGNIQRATSAKKALIGSVIGLIVALSALVIANLLTNLAG